MNKEAKRRAELRPHGITNIPCQRCEFFPVCGGIQTSRGLFNCFDESCCHREDCDKVCPNNRNFLPLLREVGGDLATNRLGELGQASIVLPHYIPVIDHRYRRQGSLDWPFVAIDTYKIFRLRKDKYRAIAESADALRAAFRLSPATKIILRGIADDPPLEEYWAYRKADQAAGQLARLGISMAIGPNFSTFLGVPRTDNVFNRKRQLICLAELAEAGISVVPHLGAVAPSDWRFWETFLKQHARIFFVAKEFQTGNRSHKEGRKVIRDMAALQQAVGRTVHPLLIGAAQFVELTAQHFERFTIIDSMPFMKAVYRRTFDLDSAEGPWVKSFTLTEQPLDAILTDNLGGYSSYLEYRIAAAKKKDHAVASVALPSA
jgi:hypothetical protein